MCIHLCVGGPAQQHTQCWVDSLCSSMGFPLVLVTKLNAKLSTKAYNLVGMIVEHIHITHTHTLGPIFNQPRILPHARHDVCT
jgi:hypothetical protein